MADLNPTTNVEYRDIPGFSGYRVSNHGSVETCRLPGSGGQRRERWKLKKPMVANAYGHLCVTLRLGGGKSKVRYIHHLVLEAFVGPRPEGMICRHLDGDATNNRLENLAWGTAKENTDDAVRHRRLRRGEDRESAILTEAKVLEIFKMRAAGMGQHRIAKHFDVSPSAIQHVVDRYSWGHVVIPDELLSSHLICGRAGLKNLTGRKFGRWTVLHRFGNQCPVRWYCRCECGTEKDVEGSSLKSGQTQSCGCLPPRPYKRSRGSVKPIRQLSKSQTVMGFLK